MAQKMLLAVWKDSMVWIIAVCSFVFPVGLLACLLLLFIKEIIIWQSLKTELLSLNLNQCNFIDSQALYGCTLEGSQSPCLPPKPTELPGIAFWCWEVVELGWLSSNSHTTSPYSSYLTVITKLGAFCHAWIGQWRENFSKCCLQILGVRSVVRHLNYKFSSKFSVWKSDIFHIYAKVCYKNYKE